MHSEVNIPGRIIVNPFDATYFFKKIFQWSAFRYIELHRVQSFFSSTANLILFFHLILVPNIGDDEDEDEEDMVTSNRLELAATDPRILKQISYLFYRHHLVSFFDLMKVADSSALLKISNFFMTLMICWPSKRLELLSSMIYTSDNRSAISLLWDTFKTTEFSRLLLSNQSISSG